MVPRLITVLAARSVRILHKEIEYHIRPGLFPSSAELGRDGIFNRLFYFLVCNFALLCVSAIFLLLTSFAKHGSLMTLPTDCAVDSSVTAAIRIWAGSCPMDDSEAGT